MMPHTPLPSATSCRLGAGIKALYMGILFVLLTAACLMLAATALLFDTAVIYLAAVAVCGLAAVGYLATRSVAFPQLADDVGNWFEPLGVLAVLSELLVAGSAAASLFRHRRLAARTTQRTLPSSM